MSPNIDRVKQHLLEHFPINKSIYRPKKRRGIEAHHHQVHDLTAVKQKVFVACVVLFWSVINKNQARRILVLNVKGYLMRTDAQRASGCDLELQRQEEFKCLPVLLERDCD